MLLEDNFGTGVRASISKPTPFIYLVFEKKWTHSYTRSSEMLTHSYTTRWFFVPIYCWYLDKYCSQFIEYQKNKQPKKSLSEKYTGMSEKVGPFIYQTRKIGSVIYFFSKKGSYTWQRWRRGPFSTHIRTMPYIGNYPAPTPPLTPPPLY